MAVRGLTPDRRFLMVYPSTGSGTESRSRSADLLLDSLYETVREYLHASLKKEPLLTKEDVRDLTADIIGCVWPRIDGLTHPMRYARRAARNRLINFLASKRRRMHLNNEWCEIHKPPEARRYQAADSLTTDGGIETRRIEFLRQYMDEEDGRTRLILHLRHASDMSWPDIADLTGVSASSARMRELRFRKRVRRAWDANQTTWPEYST